MRGIELLGSTLLRNRSVLDEIDRWVKVMDRPNGWHYDLDIIWVLENLERLGIKPGATVMDAGAGLGIPQYVLAARGYRVISLDYAPREIPARSRGIFDIRHAAAPPLEYSHPYRSHMRFTGRRRSISGILRRIVREPSASVLAGFDLARRAARMVSNIGERTRDHSRFGSIEFLHASFHEIPLADGSVDAVVSVSAVEHSEKDVIARAIAEMRRITKPGGPILVTTSATGGPKDVFHEPTQGLCFSRDSLVALVGQPTTCEFVYQDTERELLQSPEFWSRLAPYYYRWSTSLFPGRRPAGALPYLPVGLRVVDD